MNADFNAPYFHDGRYGQLTTRWLTTSTGRSTWASQHRNAAISRLISRPSGDGVRPRYRLSGPNVLSDIDDFASILEIAISQHDTDVIALAVPSLSGLLQDLADHYPDPADSGISGGTQERALARATLAALIASLHRVATNVAAGHFNEAAAEYLSYRKLTVAAAPLTLQAAQPWSLFDPELHAEQEEHRKSVTPVADTKRSQTETIAR